jgi:transglutaminase-like putative cysteine protease
VLLEIRHVTRYEYVQPVRESVMEVWMQPQKSARQRLVSFDLDLDPPAQVFSYPDTFGNAVYHFDVPQPHDRLTITARSAVETEVPPEVPARLDMGEWDRLASDSLRGDNFDYLHAHGFARGSPELDAFINGMGLSDYKHRDPLSAVRALSELIYGAFAYETGVTRADSPIEDVLRAGKGVCQDFAHLMIAVCRGWGLPARYVSGYLFTDRRHPDRSDPDASHAWVEVFLPSLRWVGIDPTNNTFATERHVICAVGRDYRDVPPSRGVFKGDTVSQLSVGVSVRRARAALSDPEFLRVAGHSPRQGPGSRRAPTGAEARHQQRLHQMQQQQ